MIGYRETSVFYCIVLYCTVLYCTKHSDAWIELHCIAFPIFFIYSLLLYSFSSALGHVPAQHCEPLRRGTTGAVASSLSRLEDDRLLRTDGTGTRVEHSGAGNHRYLFAGIQGGRQGRILDRQQSHSYQRKVLAGNSWANSKRKKKERKERKEEETSECLARAT